MIILYCILTLTLHSRFANATPQDPAFRSPSATARDDVSGPPPMRRRRRSFDLAAERGREIEPSSKEPKAEETSAQSLPEPPKIISEARMRVKLDQADRDVANALFAPALSSLTETVPRFGKLTIRNLIGTGLYTRVFSVSERNDIVIKYQSCKAIRKNRLHPLVVDFWMGEIASRLGVSPRPYFVSPGAESNDPTLMKTSFLGDQSPSLNGYPIVRYMVMEKVDRCIGSTIRKSLGLLNAATVTRMVIESLQKLHGAGIGHGDIHGGNICLLNHRLMLIDFGLGFFVSDEASQPAITRLSYVHNSLTPWQLEGLPFTRRDDVYKAIFFMAESLLGSERLWEGKRDWAIVDPEALLAWKRDENLFVAGDYDPIDSERRLSPDQKRTAKDILQEVLEITRNLTDADIPYGRLITLLNRISNLYR